MQRKQRKKNQNTFLGSETSLDKGHIQHKTF